MHSRLPPGYARPPGETVHPASTKLIVGLAALGAASCLRAQELEPRAYSLAPLRTNFVAIAAGVTQGAILFDPTLPITDVSAQFNLATIGYGRTFALGRRPGLVTIAVPYAWGHAEGQVFDAARRVTRSGFADARIRASLNLVGPPAMEPSEFARAPRSTIVGVSLTVQAPVGEYDRTKLINLGTNRWAVKPEVGVSVPVGRWYLDAYAGAWFFETNDDFFPGGATRRQDPLAAIQGHASYTFENHVWVAFDATWYGGGETTVDSGPPSMRQSNTRIGATVSIPVTRRQSLKISASTGASTRTGTDFDTYLAAWQITWFDPAKGGAP